MLDEHGENSVDFRRILVGISLLTSGTITDILTLAFELFDDENSKTIFRGDLSLMMNPMNTCASYFGDPVMTNVEIESVVRDCMGDIRFIDYTHLVPLLIDHEVIRAFVSGKGNVRYANQ